MKANYSLERFSLECAPGGQRSAVAGYSEATAERCPPPLLPRAFFTALVVSRARFALCTCLAVLTAVGFLTFEAAAADNSPPIAVVQAEDGSVTLGAANAKITGSNAKLQGGTDKNIVWWTHPNTSLRWGATIAKSGKYRVEVTYCIIGSNNGSPLAITVGDQVVKAYPKAGAGSGDYRTGQAGEVSISKTGEIKVTMRALLKSHEYVISIRSLALLPVETPSQAADISGSPIKQAADGTLKLLATDAVIEGMNARLEENAGGGEKNIGFWRDIGTSLSWWGNIQTPGVYRVELNYSLAEGYGGSKIAVTVGKQTLIVKPIAGAAWTDYKAGTAGEVTISTAGNLQVSAKAISKPYGYIANLRSVALIPAAQATTALDISDKPIGQLADGALSLNAADAEIDGQAAKLEGGDTKYLAWWNSSDKFIKWPIRIDHPGTFTVEVTYSLAASTRVGQVETENAGETLTAVLPNTVDDSSELTVLVGGQSLVATLDAGLGWDDYMTKKVGNITLAKAGDFSVVLKSSKQMGSMVLNLRSVSLVPVAK